MSYNNTKTITDNSVEFIKSQIQRKNDYNYPMFATYCSVSNVVTDMDNFPYNRYYRGETKCSEPIIMEREAGFREITNTIYSKNVCPRYNPYSGGIQDDPPNVCFQPPCTTIYPCRLTAEDKKKEIENLKNCTINISP